MDYERIPTIKPVDVFDVEKDCFDLYSATAGEGYDEEAILDIITMRSNRQRQQLRYFYLRLYNRDLAAVLAENLGPKFYHLIVALLMTPIEYKCLQLRRASLNLNANMNLVLEILLPLTNEQITDLKKTYFNKYREKITEHFSGNNVTIFRRLIRLLLTRQRTDYVDKYLAKEQARNIGDVGLSALNKYLALYSFKHLCLVFKICETIFNTTMDELIRHITRTNIAEPYVQAVELIRNQNVFYVKKLCRALYNPNIDDKALIRLIVGHSEYDLATIRDNYKILAKRSLFDGIQSTTLDTKRALCNLVAGVAGDVEYV